MKLASLAGLSVAMPRPAHATGWTYLRSVSTYSNGATSGNFAAIDASDAVLAVAASIYEYGPPYTFNIAEDGNNFSLLDLQQVSIQHMRLYYRVLTHRSAAEVFTWSTGGGGSFPSATILLFGASGIPAASGTSVKSDSVNTPTLTTLANDTLLVSGIGRQAAYPLPTAIDSGYTAVYGSTSSSSSNCSIGYKIEASSGATDAPSWTVSGGLSAVIGAMFTLGASSASIPRRVIV